MKFVHLQTVQLYNDQNYFLKELFGRVRRDWDHETSQFFWSHYSRHNNTIQEYKVIQTYQVCSEAVRRNFKFLDQVQKLAPPKFVPG